MAPMKSEAQRRWMHKFHPEMAERWEEETRDGKKLPEKAKKKEVKEVKKAKKRG
jgi:hypothetical protein